jgi:hypothetical protein
MKSVLTANPLGRRFTLILAAAALTFATAVLALALPANAAPTASNAATTYPCNPGDFCLWFVPGGQGLRYASTHSDFDLRDNLYAGSSIPVSRTSEGFNNSGVNDEVVVFDQVGGSGTASHGLCIRRNQHGDLPIAWRNRIMSFRFLSHTSCNLYPRAIPGS